MNPMDAERLYIEQVRAINTAVESALRLQRNRHLQYGALLLLATGLLGVLVGLEVQGRMEYKNRLFANDFCQARAFGSLQHQAASEEVFSVRWGKRGQYSYGCARLIPDAELAP